MKININNFWDENPPLATTYFINPYKHCISHLNEIQMKEIVPNKCHDRANGEIYVSAILLRDYDGDISKKWYIEYYVYQGEDKHRVRMKAGMNRQKSLMARYSYAKAMIRHLHDAMSVGVMVANCGEKAEVGIPSAPNSVVKPAIHVLNEQLAKLEPTIKGRSFTTYRYNLNHFAEFIGDKDIMDISEEVADDFVIYLKGKDYAPKTIHTVVSNIKNLFNKVRVLPANPFRYVKLSNKTIGDKSIPWTLQEFKKLRDYTVDKPNLKCYWGMIYYLAIRPEEISHLTADHFDLENMTVTIQSHESKVGKTQAIFIPMQFKGDLENYLAALKPGEYLFGRHLRPNIKKIRSGRLSEAWKLLVKDVLGIRKNVYQLKHTAAINMVKGGISVVKIQKHFRHHSVDMTEQYLKSLEGYVFKEMVNDFPDF